MMMMSEVDEALQKIFAVGAANPNSHIERCAEYLASCWRRTDEPAQSPAMQQHNPFISTSPTNKRLPAQRLLRGKIFDSHHFTRSAAG
jgi:hypothetical protein